MRTDIKSVIIETERELKIRNFKIWKIIFQTILTEIGKLNIYLINL